MTSWYPPPVRSAVTDRADDLAGRGRVPDGGARRPPLRAQIDPPEPTRVPSSTSSWPLPRTSARAGLLVVVPSSLSIQRGVQWALISMRSLVVAGAAVGGAGAEDDPHAPAQHTDGR